MTRRLTLLHVLWDDRDDPEPDWASRLRLAGVAAEMGTVMSEIEVPYGFTVHLNPSCGRVELVPVEEPTPFRLADHVETVVVNRDPIVFEQVTGFGRQDEPAAPTAKIAHWTTEHGKPEPLRAPTEAERATFQDPACRCPRAFGGVIVSPWDGCPVKHFQEDPQPATVRWFAEQEVAETHDRDAWARMLASKGIDPEQEYDTQPTPEGGVKIIQPSQPYGVRCTCTRGLRDPGCQVNHGPVCTCQSYTSIEPTCPAHGREFLL